LLIAWGAVFAVWSVSLSGGFLKDDDSNFLANPVVSSPRDWPSFFYAKSAASREKELTVAYRPLTTLSYAVNARLTGLHPYFFHLVDAAGHATNATLVLLIGLELCGSWPAAAAGAILFAFHPAQAESVSYASGARPSVFSLLFCLFALRAHAAGKRPRAAALFAAAALFKESALALPLALAAWDWTVARKSARAAAAATAPYFAGAVAFVALRSVVLGGTTDSGLYGGTLASHAVFALSGLATHARSALWPYGQSLCYTLTDPAGAALPVTGAAVLVAAVTGLSWGLWKRRPWAAPLAWAAAFLLPVSNLIPVSTLAADRYLYASFVGLGWLASMAIANLPARRAWIPAAALTLWLVPRCVERQLDYRSAFTVDLASHATREDACASALLAVDYFNWGMDARALSLVEQGLSRSPAPAVRAFLGRVKHLLVGPKSAK